MRVRERSEGRGLKILSASERARGRGDSPNAFPIPHVRLPRHHPDKFDLTTPTSAWQAVCRTWEYAPTPDRIVEDIERVFCAIDQVIAAGGIAVDFDELRHGRRLLQQQRSKRSARRAAKIKAKRKFGDVQGLHPVSKQCIADICDLTLD